MIFKDAIEEQERSAAIEEDTVEPTENVEHAEEGSTESEPAPETQDPQELIRAMKADRENAARERDFYKNLAMQSVQSSRPQPTQAQQAAAQQARFSNDDILTYGELDQTLQERLQSVQQSMNQMRGQFSEELVRQQYKDYDDVLEQLVAPMCKADPTILEIINNSSNPALTAYRIGQTAPAYIEYQKKQAANKAVEKIEKNLSKPKTLGSAGQQKSKFVPGKFSEENMSSEDFAKYRASTLKF